MKNPIGKEPSRYMGPTSSDSSISVNEEMDPTSRDSEYPIGTVWINTNTNDEFILVDIYPSTQAKWVKV